MPHSRVARSKMRFLTLLLLGLAGCRSTLYEPVRVTAGSASVYEIKRDGTNGLLLRVLQGFYCQSGPPSGWTEYVRALVGVEVRYNLWDVHAGAIRDSVVQGVTDERGEFSALVTPLANTAGSEYGLEIDVVAGPDTLTFEPNAVSEVVVVWRGQGGDCRTE